MIARPPARILLLTVLTVCSFCYAQAQDSAAPIAAPETPPASPATEPAAPIAPPPVPATEVMPKVEPASADDDFGSEPAAPVADRADKKMDDDFGSDDDFGDPAAADADKKMDDDFGSDDDFGDPAAAEATKKNAEKAEQLAKVGAFIAGAAGTSSPAQPEFKSAAEAHLTFLKALESEDRYPSAATCAGCHPDHYREWSVSAHAYAQMSPVFNTMHAAIVKRTSGTNGDFCIRCHTQVGMQREEPLFTSNLNRHPASIEGITCVVCHRVDGNYGKVSGRTNIIQGDIFQPVLGPDGDAILQATLQRDELKNKLNVDATGADGEKAVGKKDLHATIEKFDPIKTSGFCGACHDVNLLNGFRLEEAFTQFKNSDAAEKGQNCQDCHMGKVPGAVATMIDKRTDLAGFEAANYAHGPGARIGGDFGAKEGDDSTGKWGVATTERRRTNHMFAGPDYSIIHPALFPHSIELREALWEYERVDPVDGKTERVGLRHLMEFKWEEGWGDAASAFEKDMVLHPDKAKALPWPWNDAFARDTLRRHLNESFLLLNEIHVQRTQVLRRGVQLHDFEVTRNDERGLHFRLKVVNGTDGHGVPTGFDAERLAFLQVTVTDNKGRVVYRSGDRDPNGDVRDLHSSYVHAHAKKTGEWLAASNWKDQAGLPRLDDDLRWEEDKHLFNLQSKFITRNARGGEREQILAINHSLDPLPYIRPDTRPGVLLAQPAAARKHARGLPPGGFRWADYEVEPKALTGAAPYTVNLKFIFQMVPVNLVKEISDLGFDYNLSPREVALRVAFGHRVSASKNIDDRRGGALTIWDQTLSLGPGQTLVTSLAPSEADILAEPEGPFPYVEPAKQAGGIDFGGYEGITIPTAEEIGMPVDGTAADPSALLPKPSEGSEDDSFE